MNTKLHKLFTYLIAAVWIINGLFCKVLNLVPRHEEIVKRILGSEYSSLLTKAIGAAEICMAIWILSRIMPRLNAVTQIIIVAVMNVIEFIFAPDLLLWGKVNIIVASFFIALIYFNEFYLNEENRQL
ncbi:MAG: DoxX-like family protein [Pyrinomonadaceae bacterium]